MDQLEINMNTKIDKYVIETSDLLLEVSEMSHVNKEVTETCDAINDIAEVKIQIQDEITKETDDNLTLGEDGSLFMQNDFHMQHFLIQNHFTMCRFKLVYLLSMFWGLFLAIGSGYLLANLYITQGQNFKFELIFTLLHLLSTLLLIPQPANQIVCRLWLVLGIPWMVTSLCNVDRKEWVQISRPWTQAIMCFSVIWMLTFLVVAATDDYQNMFMRRKKTDHIERPCVDDISQMETHIDSECDENISQIETPINKQSDRNNSHMETQGKERLL